MTADLNVFTEEEKYGKMNKKINKTEEKNKNTEQNSKKEKLDSWEQYTLEEKRFKKDDIAK